MKSDCPRCEVLRDLADKAAYEQGRAQKKMLDRQDFYHQRLKALRAWLLQEVEPVLPEAAKRYWNIVADGSPSVLESADWSETIHAMTVRAERAEKALAATQKKLDALKSDMEDLAGDCYYGDGCPSNVGTRHGTCTSCKARKALEGL